MRYRIVTIFIEDKFSKIEEKKGRGILISCHVPENDVIVVKYTDYMAICGVGTKKAPIEAMVHLEDLLAEIITKKM